jgi:hypothetical protein
MIKYLHTSIKYFTTQNNGTQTNKILYRRPLLHVTNKFTNSYGKLYVDSRFVKSTLSFTKILLIFFSLFDAAAQRGP